MAAPSDLRKRGLVHDVERCWLPASTSIWTSRGSPIKWTLHPIICAGFFEKSPDLPCTNTSGNCASVRLESVLDTADPLDRIAVDLGFATTAISPMPSGVISNHSFGAAFFAIRY